MKYKPALTQRAVCHVAQEKCYQENHHQNFIVKSALPPLLHFDLGLTSQIWKIYALYCPHFVTEQ